jgi:hypothetical protein
MPCPCVVKDVSVPRWSFSGEGIFKKFFSPDFLGAIFNLVKTFSLICPISYNTPCHGPIAERYDPKVSTRYGCGGNSPSIIITSGVTIHSIPAFSGTWTCWNPSRKTSTGRTTYQKEDKMGGGATWGKIGRFTLFEEKAEDGTWDAPYILELFDVDEDCKAPDGGTITPAQAKEIAEALTLWADQFPTKQEDK